MNHRIHLKGDVEVLQSIACGVAFSPGHLIELTSANVLQKQSTAGGACEKMVAMEDALQGKTIADAYAATDPVNAAIMSPGAHSLQFLTAGETYPIGVKLMAAGDGTLTLHTGTNILVAVKVGAAVDLSASGAVATKGEVRWL